MPLTFDQIIYNEPIHYMQTKWQRKLTEHEQNLVKEMYDWCRTNLEIEEIKMCVEMMHTHEGETK